MERGPRARSGSSELRSPASAFLLLGVGNALRSAGVLLKKARCASGSPNFAIPLITLIDSTIRGNYLGGIAMNAGGTLTVQGGSLRDNGEAGEAGATRGGIWLDGAFPYALQLRGVSVIDNAGIGGLGGAAAPGRRELELRSR